MKRKLFFLLCALLLGMSNASADVILETDLTSQFSSLTDWHNWTGATGYTATNYCPMVEVSGGIGNKQVCERYNGSCNFTGDVFYATVTGLAAGTYTIELYGGAAFTFGRGFGSTAFTGDLAVDHNDNYNAGDHIDSETGVTLYAQSEGTTYGGEIPIYYATNFPDGAATVTIENVVVGASGQIKIGMSKTTTSTNWHVIQLKSVIATVSGDAVIASLKATANGLLNNATYVNVTGSERTNLQAAYDATPAAETQEAYETVISALNTAISAFESCDYTAYDKFAAEKTKATALGMDVSGYTATDAADAVTKTQSIMVDEYAYVTTNYQYGVALGEWTSTGTNTSAATFNNEHWSGETHDYKNQNDANGQGWNANSWSINFSQDVLLPSGTYVFKVAGRQASGDQVTTSLVVKKGEEVLGSVNDFPRSNNSRGINKSGETAFEGDASTFANNGNGFGWEWRYVKFTLAEESTVNIAVNAVATAIHQWVSFGDYTLQADNDDVADILAYNVAKASAITVRDDAQYANVTGSERTALVNAINADPSSDYPAATTALDNARVAFTDAKTAYNAYVAAKAVEYVDNLPYASSAKFAAIGTAQAAADATSASDAEAKTNAIISAYRKYVESNALAEGVGGIDKTNLISDANFSGVTIDGQTAGAWAFSQTGGTAAILNGESFTDGDGNANYSYFDYNNNGGNNQNLSQTLTDLPKGQYLLTVTARATTAMAGNYYLSVDFDETSAREAIPAIGNTGGTFGRGWNDVSLVFNHVSDGDVTIHVYGENGKNGWSGATRFCLVKMDQVATIGATGWTTFASAYPLDLGGMSASEGTVTAYYASSVGDGKIVMTSTTSEGVAAGTGLMLKGTAGATITIPVAISGSPIDGNHLVGCPNGETLTANANYYVLINNGGTAEFQSLKTYGATIPAGKAYLNTADPDPHARLAIVFEDDDPTAINAIEAVESNDGALKDGKYLIGNKVVLVKNGVKYGANGQKLN